MPLDPNIALGVKVPDNTQQLSSLLNVARGAQSFQNDQITLNERQALQGVLSDPRNYSDEQGNLDPQKAQANIMRVAPTTGTKYWQSIADAHTASTNAVSALAKLTDDDRSRIGSALATLPDNAPPELVGKTIDALNQQYGARIDPLVHVFKNGYGIASQQGPQAAQQFRTMFARSVLPQPTQQDLQSGSLAAVATDQGTKFVQTKTGAAQPQGAQVGPTLTPPNQFVTTPTGRMAVGNPATGAVAEPAGAPTQPPVNFPAGESKETWTDLQGQRQAAQQAANAAPVMHDINRTIVAEASKGLNTGKLGELTQKLSSATGFTIAPGSSTDYNLLGKMLERSALTAAQNMGPHTNAGLEAAVRANGSLEYTPQAIKKIAYLNDAIVSGSEMYRDGLEKAIAASPDNVFAKRQFDSQWSKVATPQVLRFKNAVDSKNAEEVNNILSEVGGKNSQEAHKLLGMVRQLNQLAGQ